MEILLTEYGIRLLISTEMKILRDGKEATDYSPEVLLSILGNGFRLGRLVLNAETEDGKTKTITLIPKMD